MEKDKKVRKVRIQEKDVELFNFVAKFGFATVGQLHTYLGGSIHSLKTRLSHLVNDGYLVNHRIFFDKPSVYTITKKSNLTDLSIVSEINLRDYYHDVLVIDVFLKIREKFAGYTTEKMIRAERGVGVGKKGRIPDLVGYLEDGRAVAVEVDRTDKSHERLKRIIDDYRMNFDYSEVWFYARNDFIYNNLKKSIGDSAKFRLFKINELGIEKNLAKDGFRLKTGTQDSVTNIADKYR